MIGMYSPALLRFGSFSTLAVWQVFTLAVRPGLCSIRE